MKTKLKIWTRIFVLIYVFISIYIIAPPLNASAEEKSYRVDSADFDIKFSENGDATITAIWNVTYTSGSFTRFYIDFFDPGNQLEYFPTMNVISCHINGTEAIASNSLDRVNNHYYFEKSSTQTYTIHWFKSAQNETVTYDITYEIPNAVKLNEDNDAEYCCRLIGLNFPKSVGHITTKVHLPNDNALKDSHLSVGEFQKDGDVIYSTADNFKGMYKLRLKMKSEYFGELQRVISVEVPQGYGENETASQSSGSGRTTSHKKTDFFSAIIALGFFAVPLILIVFGLIITIVDKFKAKALIQRDPNCFVNAASRIQSSGMPYVWYGFSETGMNTNLKYHFYAEIVDLCNKGYMKVTNQGIMFRDVDFNGEWDKVILEMDQKFLNMLEQHFPINKGLNGAMIPFIRLKEGDPKDKTLYTDFCRWIMDYKKVLKNSPTYNNLNNNGTLQTLKPDFTIWRRYAPHLNLKVNIQDCFSTLERNNYLNTYVMFQLMQGLREAKIKPYYTGDDSYYFINYFDESYTAGSSSSSSSGGGCSSCSSCSSCSGCGGGGAD